MLVWAFWEGFWCRSISDTTSVQPSATFLELQAIHCLLFSLLGFVVHVKDQAVHQAPQDEVRGSPGVRDIAFLQADGTQMGVLHSGKTVFPL